MDRRTLHRRLAVTGDTFTAIVDSVRAGLAERYLAGERYRLTEISDLLGFAAPSAFSRWFRARFGESPRGGRGVYDPEFSKARPAVRRAGQCDLAAERVTEQRMDWPPEGRRERGHVVGRGGDRVWRRRSGRITVSAQIQRKDMEILFCLPFILM